MARSQTPRKKSVLRFLGRDQASTRGRQLGEGKRRGWVRGHYMIFL
jgi:hypothetical protein